MMMLKKILLVEDDLEISELLSSLLKKEGFEPEAIFDGINAECLALKHDYDLIILDIMLPGKNGLDVLRNIRAKKSTPILMLTAKGDDLDRIIGFEMGADDYLPKPFNPRELIARINALLRRVDLDKQPTIWHPDQIQNGALTVKFKSREAFLGDEHIELTATEFNVLSVFLLHPNEVISKNSLTEKALGRKLTLYDRAIDMHVSNLRKKISDTAIKTIRGQGYMYQLSSSE
jgi:two-component system response regulator CpxR